jgi:AraC-like DNA-binding protein
LQAFDVLDDIFLFAKDADRRFVYYNTAFERLMGLAFPGELIGLQDEDVSPQYLVERYRYADQLVLRGARLDDIIELVRSSSVGYDWFITSKFPATDRDGRVIGLVGLTRKLSSREGDPVAASISNLAPAVDLMLLEYHRNLSIRELAGAACLSTSEFSRVFKRRFHVTPHQYLLQIRLELACELLATSDYSVGHIAKLTGFYDQSHMTNALVNARGVSPREYRKQFRISRPSDTPIAFDLSRRPPP